MATIKLRDYLESLSSKGSSALNDKITILDSADGSKIKTVTKSDLVNLTFLAEELRDDFLEQYGEGTISGSIQVDHDGTTNFVANEHIDHTGVSITTGNGLTGGGDISTSRTIDVVSANNGIITNADDIELDTTSTTFTSGVKSKLNVESVISSSAQIDGEFLNTNGDDVVSSSIQITITDTTGFATLSSSLQSTDTAIAARVTAIESFSSSLDNTFASDSELSAVSSAFDSTINGLTTADVSEDSSNKYYTDTRVKTKLTAEDVVSGSNSDVKTFLGISSSDISDVEAFSQSGTYSGLRAQSTTAADVDLGNVTNESKATMFTSPEFTTNPTAPTQTGTDDSTKLATTQFVQARITDIIGNAGSTLDTLGELSASLAEDSGSLSILTTTVGTKLAKASNLSDLTDVSIARANLGVLSGSSEIDVTLTTNYSSINQYTDSDNLSYLNSLLVVSKSANGDLDVDGDITASSFFIDGNTRTTGVHFANGLQHDGDGGTGIYFATDIVEIRTQNNPSLQVDSSGNTNVLFNLDVDGDINGNSLAIGTGSADVTIHAKGTGVNNRIRLEEDTVSSELTLIDVVGIDSELAGFGFGGSTSAYDLYKSRAVVLANSNLDGVSIQSANNDGSIIFGVGTSPTIANSERARVSAEGMHITGSLGISGNSTFEGNVEVSGDITGSAVKINAAGADGLILDEDTNNATLSSRLFFMNNQTSGWAIHKAANHLEFKSGSIPNSSSGVAKLKIYAGTDNVEVTDGNLVIGTAGKGIDFSATTDGSGTTTSELLDDYEEGTFTPVVRDASSAGNTASVSATASYVKIGTLVTLQVSIGSIDTTGMTASNSIYITGLPYTMASDNQTSTGACNFYNVAFGETAIAWINAAAGTDYIRILKQATGSTNSEMIVSNITSGAGEISFTISYHT